MNDPVLILYGSELELAPIRPVFDMDHDVIQTYGVDTLRELLRDNFVSGIVTTQGGSRDAIEAARGHFTWWRCHVAIFTAIPYESRGAGISVFEARRGVDDLLVWAHRAARDATVARLVGIDAKVPSSRVRSA